MSSRSPRNVMSYAAHVHQSLGIVSASYPGVTHPSAKGATTAGSGMSLRVFIERKGEGS
jgi:hypothetical protein